MARLRRWLPKIVFPLFLLALQTEYFSSDALVLKCPLYQMHLQKIIGFRPPLEYFNERNLIYRPSSNYKDRDRGERSGYTRTTERPQELGPPVSTLCWRICSQDEDCIAYVHLTDTNECYGYTHFERSPRYVAIESDLPLVADAEAIFYEKTCLKVPETCRSRLWTLTKIPGTSLVFQGKKTVPTLVTRRECAEKCLFETDFECLSASFTPSYRNNRKRFNQHAPPQRQITLGRCVLSDKDKMIQPDAFRAAPFDEEYIENQCYERAIENDHCSYELYANSSFAYAEAKHVGLSQKECQSYCTHETRFYCQGVSFYYEHDLAHSECLLHSEDIISMGPRSLKFRENSVYMRRVKCLDVQVICTHEEMAIKYTPKEYFKGKMYVSWHSRDCAVEGNGTKSTLLRLPMGNEVTEKHCGILRAYEVTKEYQRIFISALIVIQNNANVQTQGDRLIKVGCIMSNSTLKPSDDKHQNEHENNLDRNDEEVPNAIALESSLEFTQSSLPNEGSLHINTSYAHPLPKFYLQIVDLSHNFETNEVQIGQNLELQIIADYSKSQKNKPSHFDFRATSLVAKTLNNQNYVLLIDERGCPTDTSVFPALERLQTGSKNLLRARFHAFKFAGTSMVNFDVNIHFCAQPQRCAMDNCLQYGTRFGSNVNESNRQRRQIAFDQQQLGQPYKIQNPVYISTVLDLSDSHPETYNLTTDNRTESNADVELPLNYNLRVRGPDMASPNSFIYGERGVLLIAGIDDQLHMDTFCLNQSLLIALLIFWLIFQIGLMFSCCYVIQKYKRLAVMDEERRKIHESLEYLEGRRVHWADQGGYTL